MTRIADAPPASTGSSGAGPDEKKLGLLATIGGFLLGGPLGGVLMALAVGVQQGFANAGWTQPGWLGGGRDGRPSPQELRERREAAAAAAEQWLREASERARIRREARAEHRRRMREHVESGGQGDKPVRPDRRGLGEVLGDGIRTSKAWYRLLDDWMAKGNEKVNDAYGKIGRGVRGLWLFGSGLVEGVRRGWKEHQQARDSRPVDDEPPARVCPSCGEVNDSFGPACYACLRNRVGPDAAPDPEPVPIIASPTGADPDPGLPPLGPDPRPDEDEDGQDDFDGDEELFPPITDEEVSTWKHEMLGECDCPGDCRFSPPQQPSASDGGSDQDPIRVQAWIGEPAELTSGPAGPTQEGNGMTTETGALAAPTNGGAVAHVGPQGETNLDQLLQRFRPLGPLLTKVEEGVDELSADKQEVLQRVALIAGLAARKGAPTIVYRAMDEARRVAAALGAAVAEISMDTSHAQELTIKALLGLEPARAGLDRLHSVGASGDITDRVGS